MTGWRKRTIMEMAKEAGWDAHNAEFDTRIKTFAALVREDERELCAKVCEEYADDSRTGSTCARIIRARSGEQK
jgi:hypothetical protein